MLRFLALLLALGLASCDRFADEERVLDLRVVDAQGAIVRGADVHVVLLFTPAYGASASPPVRYTTSGQAVVDVEVVRPSDGAQILSGSLGIVGPGPHAFSVADLRIPNGLYTLRLRTGASTLAETAFVLNREPPRADAFPPLARTGFDGHAELSYDQLSVGQTAVLDHPDGEAEAYAVTDSLDVWIIRPGGTPQRDRVRLRPTGTTRATVTLR